MTFTERLAELGYASYGDYLRSAHWADFKARYRSAGRRTTCLVCDAKPVQLHHHTYARLGCERLADVDPLCRTHHQATHNWLKSSGRIFVEFTHEAVRSLRGEQAALPAATPKKTKKRKPRQRATACPKLARRRQAAAELIRQFEQYTLTGKQTRQLQRLSAYRFPPNKLIRKLLDAVVAKNRKLARHNQQRAAQVVTRNTVAAPATRPRSTPAFTPNATPAMPGQDMTPWQNRARQLRHKPKATATHPGL